MEAYIAAVEEVCSRLPNKEAGVEVRNQQGIQEELSSSKHNISWEEFKATKELKEDSSRVILTADKGVAMVGMDKQDYCNKAQYLLDDKDTYRPITLNPTSRLKIN